MRTDPFSARRLCCQSTSHLCFAVITFSSVLARQVVTTLPACNTLSTELRTSGLACLNLCTLTPLISQLLKRNTLCHRASNCSTQTACRPSLPCADGWWWWHSSGYSQVRHCLDKAAAVLVMRLLLLFACLSVDPL